MRPGQTVVYVVMSTWMITAVVYRIALQLSHGYALDVLPFISATLAATALFLLAVKGAAVLGLYVSLAVWLLIGSATRVALQVASHQLMDPIPAVSVALGLAAIVFLFVPTPKESR